MAKVLRNISLTIGIICGVFLICTKIGHCENILPLTQTDILPLQYGIGIGYDTNMGIITDTMIEQMIEYPKNHSGVYNSQYYDGYDFFYLENMTSTHIDIVGFCHPKQGAGQIIWETTTSTSGHVIVKAEIDMYSYSEYSNRYRFNIDGTNMQYMGDRGNTWQFTPSDIMTQNQGGAYEYLLNTNFQYYPIYVNQEFHALGFIPSLSGEYEALIMPRGGIDDSDILDALQSIVQDTADIAGIMGDYTGTIADMQSNTLKNWLNNIITEIHNGTTTIVNNLKTAFQPFWNNVIGIWQTIKDFWEWLKEKWNVIDSIESGIKTVIDILDDDLTPQNIADTFVEGWQSITLYRVIQDGIYIKDAILSLGNVEPQAPTISITLPSTFLGKEVTYTTDFAWYENVRTAVTTFFVAFITVGLGIHIFIQIPSYIHGMSGSAHGLQQGAITTPQEDWRSEYARRNNYI